MLHQSLQDSQTLGQFFERLYLRCTGYLLVTCLIRLPLMCTTGPLFCLTGLLSDLAVISILSSYSPDASYLPYLTFLMFTFARSCSPSSVTPLHSTYCAWLISYPLTPFLLQSTRVHLTRLYADSYSTYASQSRSMTRS